VFICTGNICRSPMAEALLRARLATVAPDVAIGSAGVLFDGRPAERNAVRALARHDIDLSGHRSRVVSLDLVEDAAVIIGMERRHVVAVADLDADLFARTFTLPELLRSVDLVGPRPEGTDLRSWVERAGSLRTLAQYGLADRSDEIADPMGGSARAFRACADAIDGLLDTLVGLAWPTPEPRDRVVAPTTGGIHADRDRR
jgi:protein-tyrosine phosphatase